MVSSKLEQFSSKLVVFSLIGGMFLTGTAQANSKLVMFSWKLVLDMR